MLPELHLPWLELSIAIPLLGAALCAIRFSDTNKQRVAVCASAATFLCTACEWYDFSGLNTFAAHDHWDIIRMLLHKDLFVIDELNAPLLPMTALMFLLTIVSTQRTKAARFSYRWTLLLMAVTLAILSCIDPWALIGLLSLAIVPVWMELRRRGRSTRVYLLHMSIYLMLLIGGWSLLDLNASKSEANLLPIAMLTAAALLRAGVVPLQAWIIDLFENAGLGTAFLFMAPMTGAYAVMRLVLPVAPVWAMQSIAVLSLITAVHAAGMALIQTDARRLLAYLFLSNSSLILAGVELVTPIGLTGGLCVWLSIGLSMCGLALTIRSVEARIGRIDLQQFSGLGRHMPLLSSFFLVTGLASIGFPGTIGFISTELLIEGAVSVYPIVGLMVVVVAALNGIAVVKAYLHIFAGSEHPSSVSMTCRLSERFAILAIVALIIGGGLMPQPIVKSRYHAATALLHVRDGTATDTPVGAHGR